MGYLNNSAYEQLNKRNEIKRTADLKKAISDILQNETLEIAINEIANGKLELDLRRDGKPVILGQFNAFAIYIDGGNRFRQQIITCYNVNMLDSIMKTWANNSVFNKRKQEAQVLSPQLLYKSINKAIYKKMAETDPIVVQDVSLHKLKTIKDLKTYMEKLLKNCNTDRLRSSFEKLLVDDKLLGFLKGVEIPLYISVNDDCYSLSVEKINDGYTLTFPHLRIQNKYWNKQNLDIESVKNRKQDSYLEKLANDMCVASNFKLSKNDKENLFRTKRQLTPLFLRQIIEHAFTRTLNDDKYFKEVEGEGIEKNEICF